MEETVKPPSCSGKCTGHCCEDFMMPMTIGERKRMREARIAKTTWTNDKGELQAKYYNDDPFVSNEFLEDMLISLGTGTQGEARFTCRHFDKETRLCGSYNHRPWFCHAYPGGPCIEHAASGCTFKNQPYPGPMTEEETAKLSVNQ